MKTAAWAAPTAAVSLSAPAFAVSPESKKGLQGWVTVSRQCGSVNQTITINGRGDYPDRGLWVTETTEGLNLEDATIENASITFYFPSSLDTLSWTSSSQPGWSNLTVDNSAPAISGHIAYTSTYSGGWTYSTRNDVWLADSDPYFTASRSGCSRITAYARRVVTVDGETVAFTRGPVTLRS